MSATTHLPYISLLVACDCHDTFLISKETGCGPYIMCYQGISCCRQIVGGTTTKQLSHNLLMNSKFELESWLSRRKMVRSFEILFYVSEHSIASDSFARFAAASLYLKAHLSHVNRARTVLDASQIQRRWRSPLFMLKRLYNKRMVLA